jgi:4,5-dihydroxyphthalate decarboxylase
MRRFHHGGFLVRPDAGIRHPKDLEGKRAGVRAWSVTTGVWTRGIFITDYGLDVSKVQWVVDDEEHVREMRLPDYVEHTPAGKSLADLMDEGAIQAGFAANAGIGRSGSPTGGWTERAADYPELFPDVEALEAEWHRKTGVYPMHGTIVVKEAILQENPWLARALHDAFTRAKELWLTDLDSGAAADAKYQPLRRIVGEDPLPYGMEANLPTMHALEQTAWDQGLTPRRFEMAELFTDPLK